MPTSSPPLRACQPAPGLPRIDLSRRRCLGSLGALAIAAWLPHPALARSAPALQLAVPAPPGVDPKGFLVSEKLDGARAHWDGSQLRFRSGLTVPAPGWFTAALPPVALDGELWLGRGRFETLSGLVRRAQPDEQGWRALRYAVFDLPGAEGSFAQRYQRLQALARRWPASGGVPALEVVTQTEAESPEWLQQRLAEVLQGGGEGLMLHRAGAPWRSGRSGALLKLRAQDDAEAQVLAHLPGQGRLTGRMGALLVRTPEGLEFRLGTGFSDAQRLEPPPVGSWVTYRWRGRTAAGVPRFASFVRVREF